MAEGGWIKLHRKFLNWEWSDSPEVVALFVHLLLDANHEDRKWHGQLIERGQIVTSRDKLSKLTGLSVQQVRTCLARMEQTGEIIRKSTSKYTLITVSNYARYQSADDDEQPTNNQQTTSNQPTINQQSTTNKKDKNEKNVRIDSFIPNGMCPTGQSDMAEKSEGKDILKDKHYQQIVDFWNRTIRETQSTLPEVKAVSDERKKKMKIRWKEFSEVGDPVEVVRTIFHKVATSKFCQGDNSKGWSASFDWLFGNPKNWVKVYEGNYDDNHADTRNGHQPKGDRMTELVSERNKFQQALNGIIDTIPADGGADYQGEQ